MIVSTDDISKTLLQIKGVAEVFHQKITLPRVFSKNFESIQNTL